MRFLRQRPRTLRGRVSTIAVTVIGGWLILLAVGFDLVIVNRLNTQVDDALRVRAQAATATLIVSNDTIVGVRESATDSQLDSSIWVFAGTHVLERPEVGADRQRFAERLVGDPQGFHEEHDARFYVLPFSVKGKRIGTVLASIDREPYDHTRDIVVVGSIVLVVLLALGAYPVLTRATGRALQPVERMTVQAAEWSVNDPNERFGHGQQYAELSTLAVTLDELLDRLAAVLRHERQVSAELSHELRTPLSRVAAEVDLMAETARPDQTEALSSIRASCTAMDAMMDTLLAAARSDMAQTVGRSELAPVLGALADRAPATVRAARTDLTVGVDDALVTRMLAPVVDNALRYATTRVQLQARRGDDGVIVEVTNDGPLLDPALAERVFDPGFTTDTDGREHDGAGLGLALARRLARSADGDLVVDATAAVTTFRLTLPAG